MVDGTKPNEPSPRMGEHLRTAEDLGPIWESYRAGAMVPCPRDGTPMALAVDAAVGAYRLVCVACGNASPWFESATSGVRVRGTLTSIGASIGDEG